MTDPKYIELAETMLPCKREWTGEERNYLKDIVPEADYDNGRNDAIDECIPILAEQLEKNAELLVRLRQGHHICCNFHDRRVGDCNCDTIMKSELKELRETEAKLSRIDEGMSETNISRCIKEAEECYTQEFERGIPKSATRVWAVAKAIRAELDRLGEVNSNIVCGTTARIRGKKK